MVIGWEYCQVRKCNLQQAALDLTAASVMITIAMTRDERKGLIDCVCTTRNQSLSFEFNVAVLFSCVDVACRRLQQQRP